MTTPKIIGLTGSIGMGKSTVADMFEKAGVPVFDADAEVRKMQAAGGALIEAIEAAFPGTTGPDGVDRDALGRIVFADKVKLARLEAIVHPEVAAKRQEFLTQNRDAPMVLFDIPLLFEGGGDAGVDVVLVVSASAETQMHRVLARPGMTQEKFDHIVGLQLPDEEKRKRADFVIDTDTTIEATKAQVQSIIDAIRTAN